MNIFASFSVTSLHIAVARDSLENDKANVIIRMIISGCRTLPLYDIFRINICYLLIIKVYRSYDTITHTVIVIYP